MNFVDEHLKIFTERLLNRTDIYFQQWRFRDQTVFRYGYRCIDPSRDGYLPLDAQRIQQHLNGSITLSTVALDDCGLSKWACWDSDHEDGALDKVEILLKQLGFFPLREAKRPGRDGHTWLFFDAPVPTSQLIRVDKELRAQVGKAAAAIEFFPKSSVRLSQVRMPLGINRKPEANGARGWFDLAPHSIPEQLKWFSAQPLNEAAKWQRIAQALDQIDQARLERSKQWRKPKANNFGEPVDIRKYVELHQRGSELVGACPLCRAEGHDRHGDNLRASLDGQKFCCVYGGPAQVHRGAEIIRYLTR